MSKRAEIWDRYYDYPFLYADGFDEAIIGVSDDLRIVYDKHLMLKVLEKNSNMDTFEALEYLSFNVYAAYVGEQTPIFIDTL